MFRGSTEGRFFRRVRVFGLVMGVVLLGAMVSGCASRRGASQYYAIRGKSKFRPTGCGCKKSRRNLFDRKRRYSSSAEVPESGGSARLIFAEGGEVRAVVTVFGEDSVENAWPVAEGER